MKVNEKIYDWYMGAFIHADNTQKEIFIIAVMQNGYGMTNYTNAVPNSTDYGLDMGVLDEDIYDFLDKNKLEFLKAVIDNDVDRAEPSLFWQLRDSYRDGDIFISADQPRQHILTLDSRRWAGLYTRSEVVALLKKLDNGFTIDMFKGVEE